MQIKFNESEEEKMQAMADDISEILIKKINSPEELILATMVIRDIHFKLSKHFEKLRIEVMGNLNQEGKC